MKIGSLYNIDSFKELGKSAVELGVVSKDAAFSDAASGVVSGRSTVAVDPALFQKRYPENVFLNSGIQVDNTGGYGRAVESLRKDITGGFADSTNSSDDKGKIGMSAELSTIQVTSREAYSEWTKTEVKQAEMSGINLVNDYVYATNEIYAKDIDILGFSGNSINRGLANNTVFPTAVGTPYAGLTSSELYDLVAIQVVKKQHGIVADTPDYIVSQVFMPLGLYDLLQTKVMNTAQGADSVLVYLQRNLPDIKFIKTSRLTDRMVAFSTSREAMVMRIPQPLEMSPIFQTGGFKWRTESEYRAAGLDILEGNAGFIMTGLV